jgi:hypothetical protein
MGFGGTHRSIRQIGDFGPKIAAGVQVALHMRVSGKRLPGAIEDALVKLDDLIALLNRTRELLQAEQRPA